MKSIVAEASTIAKAIEKAWSDAGSPSEFSIKIFEQPERNFLGMTTKSAKVGIFFTERLERPPQRGRRDNTGRQSDRRDSRRDPRSRPERPAQSERTSPAPRSEQPQSSPPREREARPKETWNSDTTSYVTEWLNEVLSQLETPDKAFNTEVVDNTLKVLFDKPLVADATEQRLIFSSFVHLLMETLRARFKRRFADLRIQVSVKGSASADS